MIFSASEARPSRCHCIIFRVFAIGAFALTVFGCGPSEPLVDGDAPASLRRLSEAQYRNTVADIFGASIVVSGRFDPLERVDGLLAVGASSAAITPASLERYDAIARSVAKQVVDEAHRDELISCQPASINESDAACAAAFIEPVGRLLFRRPLTTAETDRYVNAAGVAADELGNFYKGLGFSLAGMLISPKFLFIDANAEPNPDVSGSFRLDAYSKASRLSFLLWNTTPDSELLDAANEGRLHSRDGLEKQFDRMMLSSHRVEQGLRAFFQDMLHFELFETLEKDPIIYPAFGAQVAAHAQEQTLRTLTHLLLDEEADYREIFTSRKTFMSGTLGYIYKVPVRNPAGWQPYEFSEDAPWSGIHSTLSMQALFSHPGKSSPTLRGKAVREMLLCQKIPDPPGDVDFSDFTSASNAVHATARDRLAMHNEEPSCAGCHKLMDPIGLGLDNFNAIGQFRVSENGVAIDASGELDGIPFTDPVSLGEALYANAAATECLTQKVYAYAAGRSSTRSEREFIGYLEEAFADAGYSVPDLLRAIVLSNALYQAAPQEVGVLTENSITKAASQEDKS